MQDFKNQLKYYQDVEKKIIHSQNQDGIWKTPILSKSIVSNVLRHWEPITCRLHEPQCNSLKVSKSRKQKTKKQTKMFL